MSNRLAQTTSPYLLQHAENPVDWQPWDAQAIDEARRRDVPIFLSIGYSTCYWCHVMERESFEDAAIGAQMSRDFACIKVDREERPDLDDAYMAATQIMTGRGGWPMSVFLEPGELRPFWCGTYFPKTPRADLGIPSFPHVLESIAKAWREQRAEVLEQADQLASAVREQVGGAGDPTPLHAGHVRQAAAALLQMVDRTEGGFGGAPKFPQVVYLDFLLDIRERADDATRGAIDAAVRLTLDRMAIGGIHDQIGGGFHRYSVDAHWTVPHFEKMLYDQAQLATAYARASIAYDDTYYRSVAERTLGYVRREMTDERGLFFSAQDAEVDGREGLNYVWTPVQLAEALPDEADRDWAMDVLGLKAGTNFRDPHHPDDDPVNVLRLADRPDRVAAERGQTAAEFGATFNRIAAHLLAVRDQRRQPHLDDKAITAWNAMMAESFVRVGALLGQAEHITVGAHAVAALLDHHVDASGALVRVSRRAELGGPGYLDDHAHTLSAALALHEAGDQTRDWLADARRLERVIERRFAGPGGGLFDMPEDAASGPHALFVRTRTTYDGATPSAQGVALDALRRLAIATGEPDDLARAGRLLTAMSPAMAASPVATINATRSLARMLTMPEYREQTSVLGEEPAGDPAGISPDDAARTSPVQVYAGVERVNLPRDTPASLELLIKIDEGHHIIAADPGEDAPPGLVPLRVWTHGGSGVRVFADYPEGTLLQVEGAGSVRVLEGTFEMTVVLERDGEWSGRPLLMVAYQSCSETACAPPVTVELDVALDPAG